MKHKHPNQFFSQSRGKGSRTIPEGYLRPRPKIHMAPAEPDPSEEDLKIWMEIQKELKERGFGPEDIQDALLGE
jgi:hypothetical protein